MVPVKFRQEVLKTGHDSIFVGHLGQVKTAQIQSQLFQPETVSDVHNYVRSCHMSENV